MKIVGVAACTVGIAHTYMAQKAIQDECAARGIECKVEAQGGLGIENELTQEDVDSADLVLSPSTWVSRTRTVLSRRWPRASSSRSVLPM